MRTLKLILFQSPRSDGPDGIALIAERPSVSDDPSESTIS